MGILVVAFALAIAGMTARGETAGGDAQAYWAAVRIWLEGGDPYHPTGPFLPYVYAPWMLPLFVPWALLPWDVAWFVYRGGDDPAAPVVDPLGLHPAPAADGDPRPDPRVPDRRRTSTPATSTCCWRSRCSGRSSRGRRPAG